MANHFWHASGLEMSRYTLRHAFPAHLHRRAIMVLVEDGAEVLQVGTNRTICCAGDIALLAPEEVHYNAPVAGSAARYRVFSFELDCPMDSSVGFAANARRIRHAMTFRKLIDLHRSLERLESPSQIDLDELVSMTAGRLERRPRPHDWITFVAERLKERLETNLGLRELAPIVGLSPRHIARRFTAHVGLTPWAYRDAFRIELARDLLRSGIAISRVAILAGFCDQSHLTRRFRMLVGETPARFASGIATAV